VDCKTKFLAWLLRGTAKESLRRIDEAGHGTKALRMEAWTSMLVCFPPPEDQTAIVASLESVTARIDALVNEADAAITLLQERRSALISAAVTGKIDVRGLVPTEAEAA
jgi:type I restriction enzyme S subunit